MDVLPSTTNLRFFVTEKPIGRVQLRQPIELGTRSNIAVARISLTHQLFDEIPLWDTFAWNNLIQTHLSNGDFKNVLSTYHQMLLRGVRPDRHTLPRVAIASRLLGDLFIGRQVHGHALKLGFSSDQYATTALIEMYGYLDSVDMAKLIFDKSPRPNAVSWTLLARLYIVENKPSLALDLFHRMVDLGVQIDHVALATATIACGSLKSLQEGRKVHEIARTCGLEFDILVSNSLVKMYIDCDSLRDARLIFDQMSSKDIITWTSVIRAYVKKGGFNEALKLFRLMNLDALRPDELSIASILPACGRIASHKLGKEIHGYLLRNGISMNLKVQNALMDMYVKSGAIASASNVFAEMNEKDIISWTVMILGYSLHGQGKLGVDLFCQMEETSRRKLDDTTYAALLHACSTARMVEEGKSYFNRIKSPKIVHYASMVGLLARSGLFDEARIFIEEHKIGSNAEVLRKLLDGCRIHGEYSLGKQVIEQLCEVEPPNAENYVLLTNWYAGIANWHMVDKLRGMIIDMGLTPMKAYTWIVLRNKVHVFGTGDVSHPRSGRIYSELQRFMEEMSVYGRRPDSDFSLHDVDEERECVQIGHSELLALSFGLISSQAGPIRLNKNLRVCRGCHDSAKFISKTTRREIILKDPNRFHHFKDGFCSCEDFWFCLGGRLIFGPDARSLFLTTFLIVAPVILFCAFVSHRLINELPHQLGNAIVAISTVFTVYVILLLLITSGIDPAIVPRHSCPLELDDEVSSISALWEGSQIDGSRLPLIKDFIVNGVVIKVKYCQTCMLYRPPRCSHCSICNNCVERFDHHCPWVGQCIGKRNYRFFFMFVSSTTMLSLYVFTFGWVGIRKIMDGHHCGLWRAFRKSPVSGFLIVFTFIAAWFVGGLTAFHLCLIFSNQTKYENFRFRYAGSMNPYNRSEHP